jgi:sugar lactone lactonase YvrE
VLSVSPAARLALLVALALPACGAPQNAQTSATEPAVAPETKAATPPPDPMLEELRSALAAHPDDGVLLSALAEMTAAAGEHKEALGYLERLAALGWSFAPLDASFGALRDDPAYREIAARIAKNEPVVRRGKTVFTLEDPALVPEGIAHDPKTDTFYLGAIRGRKILAVGKDGAARDFVPEAKDGLPAVLGLKVDAGRRRLWAACYASKQMKGFTPEMKGTAALFQYDLDTGALVGKVVLQHRGEDHLFNDIAITPAGDVFLTDSEAGSVLVLRGGKEPLEQVLPPGTFIYPNGIVASDDGARLHVAHWRGIAVVDTKSREVRPLEAPAGVITAGIDGLARGGERLFAVQNGLGRARITRYDLAQGGDRIAREVVLESGNPLFNGIPTTGAIAHGAFYFIANSNLRATGGGAAPQPSQVLATPLDP